MIDRYTLPPDKLAKAVALAHTARIIDVGSTVALFALLVVALRFGLWAYLRARLERLTHRRWLQGVLFVPAFVTTLQLTVLPFDLWGHRLALAYGLSVESWGSWVADWLKALGVSIVIATPIVLSVFVLLRSRRAYVWVWLSSLPLQLFFLFVTPYVIDPLFNRFEPLERSHGPLVEQLERVVARSGETIARRRMFLMKASDKSTTLNAYVTGFGASKRIVVWDTTADKMPADEIAFVFGHELGHYALGHIVRSVAFFFGLMLVGAWAVQRGGEAILRYAPALVHARGPTDFASVGVWSLLITVLAVASAPVVSAWSRAQEHDADIYGQELLHGIVSDPQQAAARSFQALGEMALAEPNPSPWWVWWTYSHPPIRDRLAFAATYDPWKTGDPRFFAR